MSSNLQGSNSTAPVHLWIYSHSSSLCFVSYFHPSHLTMWDFSLAVELFQLPLAAPHHILHPALPQLLPSHFLAPAWSINFEKTTRNQTQWEQLRHKKSNFSQGRTQVIFTTTKQEKSEKDPTSDQNWGVYPSILKLEEKFHPDR